ncbi:hypothetical protein JX265_009496 [Neoarthrinium moseri]|uniref:Uncharacterized protein n=1 Tax=Neoarthrinium moseri TaxID=1658444 RepID=A0A9P9WFY2_9PEZI|nr:hypothetical protein JX265_009496 [Neoarthrinium moseri]
MDPVTEAKYYQFKAAGCAAVVAQKLLQNTQGLLNNKEDQAVVQGVATLNGGAGAALREHFKNDIRHFEVVKAKLVSLLVAWETIMEAKRHYDADERKDQDPTASGLSPMEAVLLFRIIIRLARPGITAIAVPASVKRSVEADDEPEAKRAKSDVAETKTAENQGKEN